MSFQQDMNERHEHTFRPWTRDVGQLLYYWNTLANFVSGLNPSEIKTKLGELKE